MSSDLLSAIFILLVGSLFAVGSWSAPRLFPSAFSSFPGGIENAKWRWSIGAPILLTYSLIASAFAAGGVPVWIALMLPFMGATPIGFLALVCLGVYHSIVEARRLRKPRRPSPEQMARFRAERTARRTENWRKQIEQLQFPYSLVLGDAGAAAFVAEQEKGRSAGFSPLVISPETWRLPEMTRREWMAAARNILKSACSVEEFFAEAEQEESTSELMERLASFSSDGPARGAERPTHHGEGRMATLIDHIVPPNEYFEEVAILRIPTAQSWKIPAFVLYGGWNACPDAAEIMSVAKYWREKYDADICAIGNGTLEFRVGRPPSTFEGALKLLREHILFCPEGFNDLAHVPDLVQTFAESLQSSRYWTFWWD